jgi:hypothetical protein
MRSKMCVDYIVVRVEVRSWTGWEPPFSHNPSLTFAELAVEKRRVDVAQGGEAVQLQHC